MLIEASVPDSKTPVRGEVVQRLSNYAVAYGTMVASAAAVLTLRELATDRIERSKPFIVVDFPVDSRGRFHFVIRNVGQSIAFDVSVSFHPVPIDIRGKRLSDLPFFQSPLPALQPGVEKVFFFSHHGALFAKPGGVTKFDVTVTWHNGSGNKTSELFVVDLGHLRDTFVPPPSTSESLARLADSIDRIQRSGLAIPHLSILLAELMNTPSKGFDEVEVSNQRRELRLPLVNGDSEGSGGLENSDELP